MVSRNVIPSACFADPPHLPSCLCEHIVKTKGLQTTESGTDTVGWCCLSRPDYSYEELLALDEGYRLMEAKQHVVVKQELVKVRMHARLSAFLPLFSAICLTFRHLT